MRTLLLVSALLFAIACDAPEHHNSIEYRDAGLFWDDIVCLGENGTRCYGHRPLAEELWSPVVSECVLQTRVSGEEGWWETKDGFDQQCDFGGFPSTFPEYRCFHPGVAGEVVCFGGSDGWYTEVGPACDIGPHTAPTWPTGYCEVDFGNYAYDSVRASPVSPTSGRAFDGGDHFAVIDDCKLAGGGNPPPSPFCEMVECCICQPGEAVAECYFEPGPVCPVAWEYGPLVCTP